MHSRFIQSQYMNLESYTVHSEYCLNEAVGIMMLMTMTTTEYGLQESVASVQSLVSVNCWAHLTSSPSLP